jgi:predicted nucleotidyltransferase
MIMDVQTLKDMLSTMVADLSGVSLIYLFGSQVEGSPGPMSDYDLGVVVEHGADGQRIQAHLAHELALALQTDRVDVLLLNCAPVELAYAVVAQGKVLYERDVAARVEYEAQVLTRYGDFLPVLRAQRDDILRGDEYAHRVHRYREAFGRTERTLGQIAAAQGQDSDRV